MNVRRMTTILLVLTLVVVHSVCSVENLDQNIPASDLITTDSTQNSTENVRKINSPKVLSRRKRYVAFPEGSSFSVSFPSSKSND